MDGELCISVTFLTGRYHGEEWPPSPARLYQALLAALMTCGNQQFTSEVEPALHWLESLPAPRIRASSVEVLGRYRIAVPNNDMDSLAWEWQNGRHADPAKYKTMKQVEPKLLAGPGPHVQYIWLTGGNPVPGGLRRAAHLLHTLGWGVDVAYADLTEQTSDGIAYAPSDTGDRWAVPVEGTLDDLKSSYRRFCARASAKDIDSDTRPKLLLSQAYRKEGDGFLNRVCFRLQTADMKGTRAVPWKQAQTVAAWIRHQAAIVLRGEIEQELIESYVQGHTETEKSHRLSYVPLPSIGGPSPDGAIRRAMIVEPANTSGEITKLLGVKLAGSLLKGEKEEPNCRLVPSEEKDWTIRLYEPRNPASVWRSVTPVILHGHNSTARGVISTAKTERLLLRAFAMAGIGEDRIDRLAFQAGPFFPGSSHASAIRVPKHLDGYPRLHVEVHFKMPIVGPLLAGIGRHYGIGLFAVA